MSPHYARVLTAHFTQKSSIHTDLTLQVFVVTEGETKATHSPTDLIVRCGPAGWAVEPWGIKVRELGKSRCISCTAVTFCSLLP